MRTSGEPHLLCGLREHEDHVRAAQDNTANNSAFQAVLGSRPLRKATEQGSQLILTGTKKRLPSLGQQWAVGELMSRSI